MWFCYSCMEVNEDDSLECCAKCGAKHIVRARSAENSFNDVNFKIETVRHTDEEYRWKCMVCGNSNAIGEQFCSVCGCVKGSSSARPAAAAHAAAKGGDSRRDRKMKLAAIIIFAAALILLIGLVAVILNEFGLLSGGEGTPGDIPAQTAQLPTPAPQVTAAPTPAVTAELQPATPEPTPVPTPAPSPTPTISVTGDDGYIIPGISTRYINDSDLAGLSREQLCFARNEIYARHGYKFGVAAIAAYFEAQSWYHGQYPAAEFDYSILSEIERSNAEYIRQYENKHYNGSIY